MLVLVGGLLLFARGSLTVYSFALAQGLSWAISLALVSAILWRNLASFRPRLEWRVALVLLRRAAPFALAVFLMTAYTRTDAVMIERLLVDGKVRVDHYAAAYRLLDAANMIGYLLSGLLLPMFARLIARKEKVDGLLRLALPTVLASSLCLVIPVAIYAPELTQLLYPEFADERTGQILRLLIFSFVAMAVNYVYGALLGAADELRRMNYIFAVGCVLNVAGNLLVLQNYGAIGVAAVTTATQSFISVAQAVLAHRQLNLAGVLPKLSAVVAFCGAYALLTWGVYYWMAAPWLLQFFLLGVGGLGLAFASRLLNFSEWMALIRNRG
jgi:O-antigen/teichoic acid export membrane protein